MTDHTGKIAILLAEVIGLHQQCRPGMSVPSPPVCEQSHRCVAEKRIVVRAEKFGTPGVESSFMTAFQMSESIMRPQQPKQQFGLFEAILSASVLAAAVFVSFAFFSDIRQPETVRLTYLGLQERSEPEQLTTAEGIRLCPDSDLPCLPSALDGAMFAERRSQ